MFGRELLSQGLRRVIGSGDDSLVWRDNWIDDVRPRPPFGIGNILNFGLTVRELNRSNHR